MNFLLLSFALMTLPINEAWPPLAGYDLGAREGSSLGTLEKELLPAAQDSASILDIWLIPAIYLAYGSGGHSELEDMRYYAYGRSFRSNHTYIDNIDVSDPFNDGVPLISVPWPLWRSMRFSGLRNTYGEQLGVTYQLTQPQIPGFSGTIESSFVDETGGPTLIPPHTLDGEPGTIRGATLTRREIVRNYYFGGLARYCTERNCLWFSADFQKLDRTFITHSQLDEGRRLRLASGFEAKRGSHNISLRLLYELSERPNYGGEYRLGITDLASQKAHAFHGQLNWRKGRWSFNAGYTWRLENMKPHSLIERIEITDLRAQGYALPNYGEAKRGLFQLNLNYLGQHHRFFNTVLIDGVYFNPENRERLYTYQGQSQWRETAEGNTQLYHHRYRLRTWYNYERAFKKIKLSGVLGLHAQHTQVQGQDVGFSWLSPYGRLDSTFIFSPDFFITVAGLTDVPDLPYGAILYANRALSHTRRTFWFDSNDNGLFDHGEEGVLVRQGGGDTHDIAKNLQPAREWELFIGFGGKRGAKFQWRFNIIERFYTGRYMVLYSENQRNLFTEVAFKDPDGSARGAYLSLSGSGQDLTAFIKESALWGKDSYVLENDSRLSFYQGIELQLYSAGKVGFFHLAGTAYWVEGFAPYGNGPSYNDFMAIDEESADPNWQINEKGRLDGCRALGLNILWGLKLFHHQRYGSLFWASLTRYRDGEPFSRIVVNDTLPQGATPVMANWRAGARYTFHMSADLRLAYRLPLGVSTIWLFADIYNLLDSRAEITEYARAGGNWRQALEVLPARTFMLKLKVNFGG